MYMHIKHYQFENISKMVLSTTLDLFIADTEEYTLYASKSTWKRLKGFELTYVIILCQYSVPVDRLYYNLNVHGLPIEKYTVRVVSEMILVFNCQLR